MRQYADAGPAQNLETAGYGASKRRAHSPSIGRAHSTPPPIAYLRQANRQSGIQTRQSLAAFAKSERPGGIIQHYAAEMTQQNQNGSGHREIASLDEVVSSGRRQDSSAAKSLHEPSDRKKGTRLFPFAINPFSITSGAESDAVCSELRHRNSNGGMKNVDLHPLQRPTVCCADTSKPSRQMNVPGAPSFTNPSDHFSVPLT